MRRRRQEIGWLFVAPFAFVFMAFLVVPLGYAFWLSLQTRSAFFGTRFSGIENYLRAASDPAFIEGIGRVIAYTVVMVPVQLGLALTVALALDTLATRLAKVGRLAIFLPYAVPAVIGALMWGFLYSPGFGPARDIAGLVGLPTPNFLGPELIFFGLVNIVTWQWVGYYMVIIYTALQAIDPTLYEAARIDGASGRQIATRIKIPMVASSLTLISVFAVIGTMQFFTEPQVLRQIAAGSLDAAYTPNIYAFSLAFSYSQINYSAAISFALAAVVFGASFAFLFLARRRGGIA